MPRMQVRFLAFSLLVLTGCARAAEGSASSVLMVLLRGAGWEQWGLSGNPDAGTPKLDRLARESVLLQAFHGQPLVAPALASALSGLEPQRAGVWSEGGGRHLLAGSVRTLAEAAMEAGVTTAWFGSWGLGDADPCRPQDQGFTKVLSHAGAFRGAMGDRWERDESGSLWLADSKDERRKGSDATICFRAARDFIGRQAEKPFLCVVSPPEGPLAAMDEAIGDLWEHVSGLGLGKKTLLVVTSLTGSVKPVAASGEGDKGSAKPVFTGGRRGFRGEPYEGGHAVPCLWRWPDATRAGTREPFPSSLADLAPTVAAATAWKWSAGPGSGMDLTSVLRGNGTAPAGRLLVMEAQDIPLPQPWRRTSVQRDGWTLLHGRELYDLRSDPAQRSDVAQRFPDKVKELTAAYDAWWQEAAAARPVAARFRLGKDPVTFTSADWQGRGLRAVRADDARLATRAAGAWLVELSEPMPLLVTLRRWPQGEERSIADESFAAVAARIRAGTADLTLPLAAKDKEAVFRVALPAGPGSVQGWFRDKDGATIGAYFADIQVDPTPPPPLPPPPAADPAKPPTETPETPPADPVVPPEPDPGSEGEAKEAAREEPSADAGSTPGPP